MQARGSAANLRSRGVSGQFPDSVLSAQTRRRAETHRRDDFRAIEERREPETSACDNLTSMRILEAAYRSIEEDRVVRLEETQ